MPINGCHKNHSIMQVKMKLLFISILTIFCATVFSQTIEDIDSLRQKIDNSIYTNTITITDTPKIATQPVEVQAFLNNDTLLKTIARYSNSSRLRITYYEQTSYGHVVPVYIKDVDSLTNIVLIEVYEKDNTIIKSTIRAPLDDEEANYPYRILLNSNFSSEIGFALVDRQAKKYKFIAKLINAVPINNSCGTIAWAIVQKFEVISTTFPEFSAKSVLIIQPCPEFFGENFFQTGGIYDIDVATNSGVTFSYVVLNNYKKEELSIFWTREISRVK